MFRDLRAWIGIFGLGAMVNIYAVNRQYQLTLLT